MIVFGAIRLDINHHTKSQLSHQGHTQPCIDTSMAENLAHPDKRRYAIRPELNLRFYGE
ncbi:protein of unknown function [Magnetospirillum sp. XM-1]|nr:protein of unknown function [Magnetospirillum sp. XM-1]